VDELSEAIENLGAMWDYLIDDMGAVVFMRAILKPWVYKLDKRSHDNSRNMPIDAILSLFSENLMEFSKQVHRADAHDISRVALQARFEQAFCFDQQRLLMKASQSVVKNSGYSAVPPPSIPTIIKKHVAKKGLAVNTATNSTVCFTHLPAALNIQGAPPCKFDNCHRMHDLSSMSKKDLREATEKYGGKYKQAVKDTINRMS
jgi:hypothetical protein